MANFSQQILEWVQNQRGEELGYAFLIVLLFILPRVLLKYGIPLALTAFTMGLLTNMGHDFYDSDKVISIFSTLGIISLFLFAGMEVNIDDLRKTSKLILGHLGFRSLVIALLAVIFGEIYSLPTVTGIILALALATPSTGFILDGIETANITENQKFWIKIKAISAELLALGALLILSQMGSAVNLIGSIIIIALMIVVLPYLIRKLAKTVEALAPGSEFSFIFMLAIIAGLITKRLGAYYLVGAFLVGMAAGQFKRKSPNASADLMLQSLRSFSGFFMPFYFFNSGLKMPENTFSVEAFAVAGVLFIISVPVKVGSVLFLRRISLVESWKDSLAISVSLIPNLVFGLVLADILREKMNLPIPLYGGLIIYTLVVTAIAPLILKLIPDSKGFELVARWPYR